MLNFMNAAYLPDRTTCLDLLAEVLDECGLWTETERARPSEEMTLRYCTLMHWMNGGTGPIPLLADGPSSAAWICSQILETLHDSALNAKP